MSKASEWARVRGQVMFKFQQTQPRFVDRNGSTVAEVQPTGDLRIEGRDSISPQMAQNLARWILETFEEEGPHA